MGVCERVSGCAGVVGARGVLLSRSDGVYEYEGHCGCVGHGVFTYEGVCEYAVEYG